MTPPLVDATPRTGPTGPRTVEGKKRIRLNALRHGLTAQTVVFTDEESEIYAQHSLRIHGHYKPAGPIEEALVRQIADGIWRLDRATTIEHGIFALSLGSQNPQDELDAALAPARAWQQQGKDLTLLTLYVRRIENKLAANKAELKSLQAERSEAAKESCGEDATFPQPPTPSPQSPSTLFVFSPGPSKPAPVPIKPDYSPQKDAA